MGTDISPVAPSEGNQSFPETDYCFLQLKAPPILARDLVTRVAGCNERVLSHPQVYYFE
jgi:hypothetical protein